MTRSAKEYNVGSLEMDSKGLSRPQRTVRKDWIRAMYNTIPKK